MPNEYFAVILDFTSRTLRLGFAGEPSEHVLVDPRSTLWHKFLPTTNTTKSIAPHFLGLSSHAMEENQRNAIVDRMSQDKNYGDMLKLYHRDRDANCWFDWASDEYKSLAKLLKYLLPTKLLISPDATKFFVLDRGMSALNKQQLCRSFFSSRAAVSVTFLAHAPCCAISAGVFDAILISLCWDKCYVVMMSELRILHSESFPQYSGEAMHYGKFLSNEPKTNATFDETEASIISELDCANLLGADGLHVELRRILQHLPIDVRKALVTNVIFCGDCVATDIPRIKARLMLNLDEALGPLKASAKESLGPWCGASLYCSTTLLKQDALEWKHMEITRGTLESKELQKLQA